MTRNEGLLIQAICRTLDRVLAAYPQIEVGDLLGAFEHFRYEITEAAIRENFPQLRHDPADKTRKTP